MRNPLAYALALPLVLAAAALALPACDDGALPTVTDLGGVDLAVADSAAPPMDLTTPPDFAGISCGPSVCGGSDVCCLQQGGGMTVLAACVAPGGCPDGGAEVTCDGPEDCGGSGACCVTISLTADPDGGASPSGGNAACQGSCTANVNTAGGTTKLCHSDNDCTGFSGSTPIGTLPFNKCCSREGVHFCAPPPIISGLYTCP